MILETAHRRLSDLGIASMLEELSQGNAKNIDPADLLLDKIISFATNRSDSNLYKQVLQHFTYLHAQPLLLECTITAISAESPDARKEAFAQLVHCRDVDGLIHIANHAFNLETLTPALDMLCIMAKYHPSLHQAFRAFLFLVQQPDLDPEAIPSIAQYSIHTVLVTHAKTVSSMQQ